jgi:hypothetical protein
MRYRYKLVRVLFNDAVTSAPDPADDAEYVEALARELATIDGKDPDAPAWIRFPSGMTEGICWRDQYADKAKALLRSKLMRGE